MQIDVLKEIVISARRQIGIYIKKSQNEDFDKYNSIDDVLDFIDFLDDAFALIEENLDGI